MELPKELKKEIWDYCLVNDITNIDEFVIKLTKQGFNSERYGNSPLDKTIEIKEKIIEKIVETPKEVIIEKVITNDEGLKELNEKIHQLTLKLEIEKNKNIELTNEVKKLKEENDIYGEG